MANQNPFAAFQQQAQAPQGPQNVQQPGFPQQQAFGTPPVQQPAQQAFPGGPQPTGFPQGQAQQPPAGFPQQPAGIPQQPPAQGFGGMGSLPDLSDVGESGREPGIPIGQSVLQFKANLLKTRQGHTAICLFTSVQSTSAEAQPGTILSFVKKLPAERDKQKTAIGYALSMIRAMAGYNDEASFKAAFPQWSQLLSAFMYADPSFAAWANGRKVGCVGTQGEEVIDRKTGQRTGRHYVTLNWFPVAQ